MIKPKLEIVSTSAGDWDALYVDDVLFAEGHSILPEDICKALGIELIFSEAKVDYNKESIEFGKNRNDITITRY